MNNNNSDQKIVRKKYNPQFKDQTLERAVKDVIPQVAKDLGIKESIVRIFKYIVTPQVMDKFYTKQNERTSS